MHTFYGHQTIIINRLRDHFEMTKIIQISLDKAEAKTKYKAPHANRSGEEIWKRK